MSRVKIKWYGERATKKIYKEADQRIKKASDRIANKAKTICPSETGKLKESIRVIRKKQMNYRIGSDVSYAMYVEYGTSKMSPKPYLRPAVKTSRGI